MFKSGDKVVCIRVDGKDCKWYGSDMPEVGKVYEIEGVFSFSCHLHGQGVAAKLKGMNLGTAFGYILRVIRPGNTEEDWFFKKVDEPKSEMSFKELLALGKQRQLEKTDA